MQTTKEKITTLPSPAKCCLHKKTAPVCLNSHSCLFKLTAVWLLSTPHKSPCKDNKARARCPLSRPASSQPHPCPPLLSQLLWGPSSSSRWGRGPSPRLFWPRPMAVSYVLSWDMGEGGAGVRGHLWLARAQDAPLPFPQGHPAPCWLFQGLGERLTGPVPRTVGGATIHPT